MMNLLLFMANDMRHYSNQNADHDIFRAKRLYVREPVNHCAKRNTKSKTYRAGDTLGIPKIKHRDSRLNLKI